EWIRGSGVIESNPDPLSSFAEVPGRKGCCQPTLRAGRARLAAAGAGSGRHAGAIHPSGAARQHRHHPPAPSVGTDGGRVQHLPLMSLGNHEMSQLAGLHAALKPGDVLLADRGFCSFVHLALLSYLPVDAVFRMHQRQIVDFTPNRPHRGKRKKGDRRRGVPTSRFLRQLGQEDQLVEWTRPTRAPAWVAALFYAALPSTVRVRELRYRITTPGRRTRVVTIATTLLDPMRYPKRHLAALYGLRWEVETNFRHLKQAMGMDRLK